MRRVDKIRVGRKFVSFRNNLKQQFPSVSDRELTDGIADFLDNERLTPIMIKRASVRCKKRRRGLFD